jgi:hypothetical protein
VGGLRRISRAGRKTETAKLAKELRGVETIDGVPDRGHFKAEDIEAGEEALCATPASARTRTASLNHAVGF